MKVGNSVKIRESTCLSCGYFLDAATPVEIDHPPSSGDITVCIACGHIMYVGGWLVGYEHGRKSWLNRLR